MINIGDHVAIRLPDRADDLDNARGEQWSCGFAGRWVDVVGHAKYQDGRTGVVKQCAGGFPCESGGVVQHGYFVWYDEPHYEQGLIRWGGHYSADELVPA